VGPGLFLPRVGIAYRATENTVIRTGFGLSGDPYQYIDFRNAYSNINKWQMPAGTFNGVSNAFVPVTNFRLGLNEAAFGRFPNLDGGIIPLPPNTGTITWPKNVKRKYVESWNFMVQRQFGGNTILQGGYVGTRSVGVLEGVFINAGPPAVPGQPQGNNARPLAGTLGLLSNITVVEPFKTNTYDALQTQLPRRWNNSTAGVVDTW